MRALLSALTLFALVVACPPWAAAQSLESALAVAWSEDDGGLKVLRTSGATLGRVLVAERVPSGAYVVEVALGIGAAQVRYPLKLRRDGGAWLLDWQPAATYAGALLGLVKSGALPELETGARWTDVARLPALPVVGTRARYVTPFGEVELEDRADGAPPQDLEGSPRLMSAAQRWVGEVLEDDLAPAGIDLILDRALSWRQANKVLFNLAAVGLYQVSIVTAGLDVVRVSSPVARAATHVVALYHLTEDYGVRVSSAGELLAGDGCAPEMSACMRTAGGLPALLGRVEGDARSVMFAAAGDVAVGDALPFLAATNAHFALLGHRLLIGYVQR